MWRAVVMVVVVCMASISHAGPLVDDAAEPMGDTAVPKEQAELLGDILTLKEPDEPLGATTTIKKPDGPLDPTTTLKKPDEPLGPTASLVRPDEPTGPTATFKKPDRPLGDTLDQKKPAEDSQLRALQQNSKEINSSGDDNPPSSISSQRQGDTNVVAPPDGRQEILKELKYPDHSTVLPFQRIALGTCQRPGAFPNPESCRYFSFCVPIEPEYNEFLQTQHICDFGYIFDEFQKNCVNGDCLTPVLNDPPRPLPPGPELPIHSSPLPQVPEWFNKNPSWFDETPLWFKTPPSWFHTPPAWLNAPPKTQVLNEQIKVEAGPGKPDQIIKNVGMPDDSSTKGEDKGYYNDDKTMRIDIPIKIIQQ